MGSRPGVMALAVVAALACTTAAAGDTVRWREDDARPIGEPAVDDGGDHVWRDGAWTMTGYQLRKILDPAAMHLVDPREAANLNALDEVPDSTWFTNRHARRRLSAAELARGPNRPAHAPAATGPLTVLSGKPSGMTAGFIVRDAKGDRYVVKFDPPGYPEVPTGAEMVCTKILHALGWNVPENYLLLFDPRRLALAPDAWTDDGNGREALTPARLEQLVARAGRLPDGRIRALASRFVAGKPKGGFLTIGRRADDPNDTVPHEDRRELRGLRIVAAWLNYTDARRGNFLDSFVTDPAAADGRGHLVHYVLDFSSALGSGNDDWKSPRYGHEYYFDPGQVLLRAATLGMSEPAWKRVPLAHPALGYLDAESFEPEAWRTTYPNPLFDHATIRDAFWGAKLVSSLTDADLAVVTRAGAYTDQRAAAVLADILRRRQRKIAEAYFDWRHINPLDGFTVRGHRLEARDLAVENGVAVATDGRYRRRVPGGSWTMTALPVSIEPTSAAQTIEIETSHDRGTTWSPATRVTVARGDDGAVAVQAIERATR